jgi:hypothetical protein
MTERIESLMIYTKTRGEGRPPRVVHEFTTKTPLGTPEPVNPRRRYEGKDEFVIPMIIPTGPPGPDGMVQGMAQNIPVPVNFTIDAGNIHDAMEKYDAIYDAQCALQRPQAEKALQAKGLIPQRPQSVIVSGAGAHLPPPPGAPQRGDIFKKGRR